MNDLINPELLAKLSKPEFWRIEGPPETVKKVEEIIASTNAATWAKLMHIVIIDLLTAPNEDMPEYRGGWFIERD